MRKTLFSKIFITQVISALTVVVMIVPMVFVLIGDYFVSVQKDNILQDASRVANIALQISDISGDERIWEFFRSGIELLGKESTVLVVNSEGDVIAAPHNLSGVDIGAIDKSFISRVKKGKSVVMLFDKGKIFDEKNIVAMVPIVKVGKTGERTFLGASVAVRPIPQLREIQYKLIGIILVAQLIAWIVALIVSFVITRQITKPIKNMRNAAKSISAGNFNEKIPITSNDEIGDLAQSFNSMTRSLSELEDMRTSFLSDVSHELRTPMTIIGGFVEGILDGTISAKEEKKYLGIVLAEVKRLSRMVSDLLESTRLEQGKVKINKTCFDMNRLVTESIIAYEQQLTEKAINVRLELDETQCCAFADKDSIKRVLINLIDNAIKFTPTGGNILLSTSIKDAKVEVMVENTGVGISEDDLRHIWERFYKSDKSRSMDKKGVGLGLHIVKTIISQNGGEIYAESREGEFARFRFVVDKGNDNALSE